MIFDEKENLRPFWQSVEAAKSETAVAEDDNRCDALTNFKGASYECMPFRKIVFTIRN